MEAFAWALLCANALVLPFLFRAQWKAHRQRMDDLRAERGELEERLEMNKQLRSWLGMLSRIDRWHQEHSPTHGWIGTCKCDLGNFYIWQWDQTMMLMLFLGDDPRKVMQDSIDRVMSEEFPDEDQGGESQDDEDQDDED